MAVTWKTQRNWSWCSKCQGLFYGPGQASSNCPEGGTHTGGGNYSLVVNTATTPTNHQAGWRKCAKCQGLFYGPSEATSKCPEGGAHSRTGSGNYAIAKDVGAGVADWRWCTKCQGLWLGPNEATSNCPTGGKHSPTGSSSYRIPAVKMAVNVHTKVLTVPNMAIATLFQNMREVYASCNVDVQWVSDEALNLPALTIVDVGTCVAGTTTTEQKELFNNRNSVGTNEMVVYFVESTNPPLNGCASYPSGKPGAIVVKGATQWTFPHELGHVLGLTHVSSNDRLMTGNGTANITSPPPDLIATECTTMKTSVLTTDI